MRSVRFIAPLLICALVSAPASAKPKVVKVKLRCDSDTTRYEAYLAMDGNPRTMWHTAWGKGEPKHPHEIVVDLGKAYDIAGISYLPRTDRCPNGTIKDYELYVSERDKECGEPVAKGAFTKVQGESLVEFPQSVKGRYVRLRALSEVYGRAWASIAELRILSEGVHFKATPASGLMLPECVEALDTEAKRRFVVLLDDLRKRRRFEGYAPETFREEELIQPSDRDPADAVSEVAATPDRKRSPKEVGPWHSTRC